MADPVLEGPSIKVFLRELPITPRWCQALAWACETTRVCVCDIDCTCLRVIFNHRHFFCFSIWVQEVLLVGCCQATRPLCRQLLLWLSGEAAASEVKRFPASQPATLRRPLSEHPNPTLPFTNRCKQIEIVCNEFLRPPLCLYSR